MGRHSGPKIVVPVMVWGRWDIFNTWAKHMKTLPVDVLCVGSEGAVSQMHAERYGFMYRETPNEPLGAKAQARLDFCKGLEWDYLLFLAPDDFITRKTLDYYLDRMAEGYGFIAPMDLYYWAEGALHYSDGYADGHIPRRVGEPMAVGRCVSRATLAGLDYELWPRDKAEYIDRPAWKRLRGTDPETWHLFTHKEQGTAIIDVKDSGSVSQWSRVRRYASPCSVEHTAFIYDQLAVGLPEWTP